MVFFKQKTAYEMRISDWSSDVCSSDLDHPARTSYASPSMVTRLLRSRRAAPTDTRPPDIARPLRESATGMISREGNATARVLGRRNGTYHRNVTRNSPPCPWKEHLGTSARYFQPVFPA